MWRRSSGHCRRGDGAFPYAWTTEWHKTDHGIHVHFAVGRYIARSYLVAASERGFVHIKLLGDLPTGPGVLEESRKAAGYLAKYVSKAFTEDRVPGLHRYEVAQKFQPEIVQVWGHTAERAVDNACELFNGRRPVRRWSSADVPGWEAPPALWVQWR